MINEDVYSVNRNVKLIEKGIVVYLMYKMGMFNYGQGVVFIVVMKFRICKEFFIDILLIDIQVVGVLGEVGVLGWIDIYFVDCFMGVMMVGMIFDVVQVVSGVVKSNKDNQIDYIVNSCQVFVDIVCEVFVNSVNIFLMFYKNQGEIIILIVGQDLDFFSIYKLKMVGIWR